MSEIHRSEIIYEEGWRESAPAADAGDIPLDEADSSPESKAPEGGKPLLIALQLILCLLAALALFLLKTMDSEPYHDFMKFYHEELNKPIISQGVFDALDISKLLAENSVTVQATPDEIPRR